MPRSKTEPEMEQNTDTETIANGESRPDTARPSRAEHSDAEKKRSSLEETKDNPKEKGGPKETGGREGLDPTRYGDWEKAGRCIDF